jgi:hypothetical protein
VRRGIKTQGPLPDHCQKELIGALLLAKQQNQRNPEIQRILLQLLAHYITQLAKLEPDESPDDVLLGIKLTCGLLRSGTEHWGSEARSEMKRPTMAGWVFSHNSNSRKGNPAGFDPGRKVTNRGTIP